MRVEFCESQSGIGIPYPAVERTDGHSNYGYFDLKRKPDLIDTVVELQDSLELMALVREMNDPRSVVRSLACEKALSENRDPVFQWKLTSFVRLSFEILAWNFAKDNYRKLYDQFADSATPHLLSDLISIEFEVDPANFVDHQKNGWSLTIWNNGYGRTGDEARSNWATGVRLVEQFFAYQRMRWQGELDKGLVTVS
jgi:hypothetical protein